MTKNQNMYHNELYCHSFLVVIKGSQGLYSTLSGTSSIQIPENLKFDFRSIFILEIFSLLNRGFFIES